MMQVKGAARQCMRQPFINDVTPREEVHTRQNDDCHILAPTPRNGSGFGSGFRPWGPTRPVARRTGTSEIWSLERALVLLKAS